MQPVGTLAAEAIRAVLEVLKEAGSSGLSGTELSKAVQSGGVKPDAEDTAKVALRRAVLILCEYLDGYDRSS